MNAFHMCRPVILHIGMAGAKLPKIRRPGDALKLLGSQTSGWTNNTQRRGEMVNQEKDGEREKKCTHVPCSMETCFVLSAGLSADGRFAPGLAFP